MESTQVQGQRCSRTPCIQNTTLVLHYYIKISDVFSISFAILNYFQHELFDFLKTSSYILYCCFYKIVIEKTFNIFSTMQYIYMYCSCIIIFPHWYFTTKSCKKCLEFFLKTQQTFKSIHFLIYDKIFFSVAFFCPSTVFYS